MYGSDLNTGKRTEFNDGSGWLVDYINEFMIGDSLIKQKDDYNLIIKRKGKTISIPCKCGGKIYKNK